MSGYDKIEQPGDKMLNRVVGVVMVIYCILFGLGVVSSLGHLMLRVGCVQ